MNKFLTKTLLIVLSLTTAVASTIAIYLYLFPVTEKVEKEKIVYQPISMTKTIQEIENEKTDAVEKDPKPVENLSVAGWIPDWDITKGLDSVKKRADIFDSLSPVWFYVNDDGSLKDTIKVNDPELLNYARDNNIELIPTISLFDAQTMSSVLRDETNLSRHIDDIVKQIDDNDYNGIDLDYESIRLADQERFFLLLEKLSDELHARNKKLIVTVLAKWGETFYYNSLPETRQVQDYKRVMEYADEMRIMTYNYVSRGSMKAGPIAPVEWMEHVIKYAISTGVPRDKLMLGIHNYAYDWPTDNVMTEEDVRKQDTLFSLFYEGSSTDAEAFFYGAIPGLLNDYDMQVTFNETWGEAIGKYNFEGKPRTVIFMNEQGIEMRKQLAADYGLKGVVFWRLGGEGELKY